MEKQVNKFNQAVENIGTYLSDVAPLPVKPRLEMKEAVKKLESYNIADEKRLAEADQKTQGRVSRFIHSGRAAKVLATAVLAPAALVGINQVAGEVADTAVHSLTAPGAPQVTGPQSPVEKGTAYQLSEHQSQQASEQAAPVVDQQITEQERQAAEQAQPTNMLPTDTTGVHVG